jgi:hypothetical protein
MNVQDKDEMPGFPCLAIRAGCISGAGFDRPEPEPELLLNSINHRSLFCHHDYGLHLHYSKAHAKVTDTDPNVCDLS